MTKLLVLAAAALAVSSAAEKQIVLRDANGRLEATISPEHGGEICSLRVRHAGQWRELLYRACDYATTEGWRGKAPLLWPATGGTSEGHYRIGDAKYEMPFHGFAQSMPWTVEASTAASARLSIHDTEKTRVHYPFGFGVEVSYAVKGGAIEAVYRVRASKQNTAKMFFSIGNHITFRVPLLEGTKAEDVTMEVAGKQMFVKDGRNFPTGKLEDSPLHGPVRLGDVPALKVISLTGFAGRPSLVLRDPAGLRVRLSHEASKTPKDPYIQFNLWGDAKAGYYSPEPWVGAQNSFNLRLGLVELAPGEEWEWRIDILPEHGK